MPLETYTLDSILEQGKCKGNTVREVYQFAPDYLEWIIANWEEFWIDLNLFKSLPKPTPFIPFETFGYIKALNGEMVPLSALDHKGNPVIKAMEFIKDGNHLAEIEFSFSGKTIMSLEEKKDGTYEKPNWISLEDKPMRSYKELMKERDEREFISTKKAE